MHPVITIELPKDRLVKEDCMEDEYLLNQMHGVNDNPPEDNLPLRKWIIREAHVALQKNAKVKEVRLQPKADKTTSNIFTVVVTGQE